MDKEAFWVNVHEDKFEDQNLFEGLLENFAVATKGDYWFDFFIDRNHSLTYNYIILLY